MTENHTAPHPAPLTVAVADRIQGKILAQVVRERRRQIAKWGPQAHPDIAHTEDGAAFRRKEFIRAAQNYKDLNDARQNAGQPGIWADIWLEEIFEALESDDPADLRKELVESIAVALAWLEDLDSREEVPSGA